MKKQDLLKYLRQCKDLELDLYGNEKEIKSLRQTVSNLGIAYRINEPVYEKPCGVFRRMGDDKYFWISIISLFLCIWIVLMVIIMTQDSSSDFIGIVIAAFLISIIVCVIITVCGAFLPFVLILLHYINPFTIITSIIDTKKDKEECQRRYQAEMNDYRLALQQDAQRVANEQTQAAIIQNRISQLEAQKRDIQSALDKLYDVGVVYAKYRDLVPIVMFCEYLESSRCDALEGHEGAYNIYENELRQNIIISKLDVVIKKLNEIKENQWMLYDAIERGNQNVQRLCQTTLDSARRLESIDRNAAINAENSRIAAQNTETLKKIEAYRLLVKGY